MKTLDIVYKDLETDPSLRGVVADILDENPVQRWLYDTDRRPLIMPMNQFLWFEEGSTSLIHSTLPSRLFCCLKNKHKYFCDIRSPSLKEADEVLLTAWNYAISRYFWKFIPNNNLFYSLDISNSNIYTFYETTGEYGGYEAKSITPERILADLAWGGTKFLYLEAKIGLYHIPVIDADSEAALSQSLEIIKKNSIPYAVFQSSSAHYWIILDHLCKDFDTALVPLLHIDGNDIRYRDLCNYRKMFSLRAEYKGNISSPKLIENNVITPALKNWINQFLEYWDKKKSILESIFNLKIKNNPKREY